MYPFVKRFADIVLASLALLLLAPLLLPLVLALRMTGEGEVFYRQQRLGYKQRPFGIYKFATMLKDSPNMPGGIITLRDDPRITPLGGFLRKTKINELPQILNVLNGQMSVVGPRPLMRQSFLLYSPDVQAIVYESRPGLTGIASLVFRDEERFVWESGWDPKRFYEEVIYPYKGELEAWYYHHRSLRTDALILLLTALAVVQPRSKLAFRVFPDLPRPPAALAEAGPQPA